MKLVRGAELGRDSRSILRGQLPQNRGIDFLAARRVFTHSGISRAVHYFLQWL